MQYLDHYRTISSYPATSLGENDLGRVFDEVMSANHNWFNLGLKLKLNVTTLVCVRDQYTNPSTALREMLLHWLKTADPPPTWEGLACALESHTVGESRLAEQLRTKYCKTEEAAGQLLYITKTIRSFLVTRLDCFCTLYYPHCNSIMLSSAPSCNILSF